MSRKKGIKVYLSSNPINKKKSSNPLANLSYDQLEILAGNMLPPADLTVGNVSYLSLPSVVKHKLLLALVLAKNSDREDIVDAILSDLQKSHKNYDRSFIGGENKENLISNTAGSSNLSNTSTFTYYSSEFNAEETPHQQFIPGAFELCQLPPLLNDNFIVGQVEVQDENTRNSSELLDISDSARSSELSN